MMEAKKVIIVVPDDSTAVWSRVNMYEIMLTRGGVEVSIKTESKLQESDFVGNIWVMGPIADFSHWDKFDIPVEILNSSFKIGKYSFEEPSYGFFYNSRSGISPVRLATSGNSLDAYIQTANMLNFGFEYIVANNAIPELIGNGSHIADLNALRETIYTLRESKYYTFMISKNLPEEELEKINDDEIRNYDNHIEAFVKKMELSFPEKKIKTYFHATQEEICHFSNFFFALCRGTVWGNVVGDEIHNWKVGGAIEHEANHFLFNQVNKMAPTFFIEGIQKWYEYTVNAEYKESGFQKAREFADEDLTDVIFGRVGFFQGDKYYLISGIFTDYLIDAYGLDKFKELYKYETFDLLQGFENTYNKPLSEILIDYKKWLLP